MKRTEKTEPLSLRGRWTHDYPGTYKDPEP